MKTLLIVAIVAFLGVSTVDAAIALIKDVKVAEVGTGDGMVSVSKIVDGGITCYVSRQGGKLNTHGISCVK